MGYTRARVETNDSKNHVLTAIDQCMSCFLTMETMEIVCCTNMHVTTCGSTVQNVNKVLRSLILALLEFKYVQCTELSDPHQIILHII